MYNNKDVLAKNNKGKSTIKSLFNRIKANPEKFITKDQLTRNKYRAISDFISGAVESLAPENDTEHWDIIEGQGSLFHPSYAGVTAGLIHGAQADALVLCHEPTRDHMRGLPHYSLPSLEECMKTFQLFNSP